MLGTSGDDAGSGARPDDLDGAWKEALDRFFEPFLALLFPEAHSGIDWSRGYESLDNELQQVVRDAEIGRRLADRLVRVWRPGGEEVWVLVHVEVQGRPDPDFPERMYVYNYRVYDRYRRPVASLAVLADASRAWRPDRFGYDLWGSRAGLEFVPVKLLDWEDRWPELERSDNPFALIVMAHLRAQSTRKQPQTRLEWKLRLARMLYRSGLNRDDVLELFRFLDWMMALPPELERGFDRTLEQELEATTMPYVTRWEQRGREEGRREGLQEGLQEGVRTGLRGAVQDSIQLRFKRLPGEITTRLEVIEDIEALRALHQEAIASETLEAFLQALARYSPA
ncbi:MAG: hypothetical protein K0Q72_4410 [Armatimonadetes bacterium]|jgi:hypothetical protein|nr:hypothetical protein [Armatimonadota bacterium]